MSKEKKGSGFKDVISGLFGKPKESKGGSKGKKEKHEDGEKKTKPRSGSIKCDTPPVEGVENPPPPSTSNGRGSHNDDGNTTGEVSPQETRAGRSPSITSQPESISVSGGSSGGSRTHSPATSVPISAVEPSTKDEVNEATTSPRNPSREDKPKPPPGLSPDEMVNRRKSPAPLSPKIVEHLQHDKSMNSSTGSMDLPQLDAKGDADKDKKKISGSYVPPPFAPRIEDTPPPKQRASGPPEILPEEITYENSDLLGHGSFGSVYKGRCRGQEVAVKVPKKQKLTMAELTSFRNEVKIMSVIYHPHVVLFLGACTQLGKMQIVTELCFTDMEKYLASDRIVHLDLKSANLLLDNNLRVKVTDFGFSQIKDTLTADKAKKGTPLWMAPEVMMGNKYDEKADVYSFGIILWEILTRDVPYAHHNDYATFFRAVCIDKERPPIPPHTLPSLTHLITSCWDFDPRLRPTFEEIIFRLNVVLVDCAIENEEARHLWKQQFLLPKQELVEQVPWAEFDTVVRKSLGRDDIGLGNLRELLVSAPNDILKGKEVVSLDRFDKVVKWFGMFFSPEVGPSVMHAVNELVTKSWFHGDISKEDAMQRLSDTEEGTFLIRLSSTDPKISPFTLSMTNNQHRRIRRLSVEEDGVVGYNIQSKAAVYSTLTELAEKCVDYNLRIPCPKIAYNPYGDGGYSQANHGN